MKRQVAHFGIVGLLNNAVLYALFLVMIWLQMDPYASQAIAFLTGTLIAFTLNRRFTFRDDQPVSATLPKFFLLYGCCYILNLGALAVLLNFGHLPPWLAQAICIVLSAIFLFIAQRSWIFRSA